MGDLILEYLLYLESVLKNEADSLCYSEMNPKLPCFQ